MIEGANDKPVALPDDIKVELIKSLLSSLPQAASISATSACGAAVLALRSGSPVDQVLAFALTVIGIYRVAVLVAYRYRRNADLTSSSATQWLSWQAIGLLAQAAVLGFQSLHAFMSGDTAAALLSLGFVMAFCGGACARLSVVPWIPVATSLLLLLPTIVGAVLNSEAPIVLAGIFLVAFIAAMTEATFYLHRLVVDRLLALREASHRASYDGLTGLPNRATFHRHLAAACRRMEAEDRDFAVLYLDLDSFKAINDRLGHAAGDDVLTEVARRLSDTVGPDDLACRLGGDEFAILIGLVSTEHAVAELVGRLSATIMRPISTAQGQVFVGASIGSVFSSTGASNSEELLKAADRAMYAEKAKAARRRAPFEPPTTLLSLQA